MANEGPDIILFLDKSRLYIYAGDGVERLDFPENLVRDFEIVDKGNFDGAVDVFIKAKKIKPGKIWVVLSGAVSFNKEVPAGDPDAAQTMTKDFLEEVPFDQIISRGYRSQAGIRVISTNLEIIEALEDIFARDGFIFEGIVPSAIFPNYNTKKILDADFARFALANRKLMYQANMLQKIAPQAVHEAAEAKTKSKYLPYLLAGFGALILILILTIVLRK
jgi:hypothetical protein